MNAVEVGERIASLRREKGLTQKELAGKIFVTDKAVSKWERGLNYPELSTLSLLAEALGVSPAALLGLEEKAPEEVLSVSTEMHEREYILWLKELRKRAIWAYVTCITIIAALFWLFNLIQAQGGLYGLPRGLKPGLFGFLGTLMGNEVFTFRTVSRRLKAIAERLPSAPDRSA